MGAGVSSHSSMRIKSTPSARGTGHFMVTEMARPGVAWQMRGGATAEKGAPIQVRKRSPDPSHCVDCGICCLRGRVWQELKFVDCIVECMSEKVNCLIYVSDVQFLYDGLK